MIDHDVSPGHLAHCQICGSEDLREIIDLGHQPLCDALLTADQLNEPETHYPLRLMQCAVCTLAQLDYVVPGEKVYPHGYPYRAGLSWPVVEAHRNMSSRIVARFGPGFVVDIGSNDGTLLSQFQAIGCSALGVEPTDIADIANAASVPTLKAFFTEELARDIAERFGYARVITMTNVFAHMAELGEVMRGVCALLDKGGVLVIENHYLLDILEHNQFDSIYHEHVRTYTLRSLVMLFEQYGMEVFDAERVPRYGGNIRAFVARTGAYVTAASVGELLRAEHPAYTRDNWARFRKDVAETRRHFWDFLRKYRGRPIVGCSAPGRASTLLNYYGIEPRDVAWTGEIEGSLKIGKHLPGCHIPVVSNRALIDEKPEHVVLLAWHYAKEITERLRREGVNSRLYAPLPQFHEVTQ